MNGDDIQNRRPSLVPMPSRMELLLSRSVMLDISESDETLYEEENESKSGSAHASFPGVTFTDDASIASLNKEADVDETRETKRASRVTFTGVTYNDDTSIVSFDDKPNDVHQNEVNPETFNDSEISLKSQSTRITLSSHRDMIQKLTSDLSSSHSMKRSTKEVIKLSHFDTARYIMTWVWVLGALVLMFIFGTGGWAFPDGGNPTCDDNDAEKNASMCGMIDVIKAGTSSLAFLSGFIIAGFVSSARSLWLTRRTAYCELANATKIFL